MHRFDLLIAPAADAKAICVDTEGEIFEYKTIEGLHHFCLFLLLGIYIKSTRISELGKQFPVLAAHSGSTVALVPETLTKRLAKLKADDISELTDRWYALDSVQAMEVKRSALKSALTKLNKLSSKSLAVKLPLLYRV